MYQQALQFASFKVTDLGTSGKPVRDYHVFIDVRLSHLNNDYLLTYLLSVCVIASYFLSRTVSKISRIISQIFAVDTAGAYI